jgi:hypothetical protein
MKQERETFTDEQDEFAFAENISVCITFQYKVRVECRVNRTDLQLQEILVTV